MHEDEQVLNFIEAEGIIKSLKVPSLKNIGSLEYVLAFIHYIKALLYLSIMKF